jgi:predicted MFS family arabinose efflux permease
MLVSSTGWRAIFWINIPIGIAAVILTQRFVPESRAPRARRFDPPGCGVAVLVLGFISTGHWAAGTAERSRRSPVTDASKEVPHDPAVSARR